MQVLKFGGTSVANAVNIKKVTEIVCNAIRKDRTILVSSAISGCTDLLIETGRLAAEGDRKYIQNIEELERRHMDIIREIIPADDRKDINGKITALFSELKNTADGIFLIREFSKSTCDLISGFGELFSTAILTAKFKSLGISCKWVDSRRIIKTELCHSSNNVLLEETYRNIRSFTEGSSCDLYILPGFISSDSNDRTTTLGRGGSDYTAALIAAGCHARILEIWTDVSGMKTADPRIVPDAATISHISYKEALELSHFGAKVVYPPTIQPVIRQGIPIYIKNTFEPEHPGTLIESNPPASDKKIRGISSTDNIALISMEGSGMVGIPGYSGRLFETLAREEINIILITQASSVHTMCVAIDEKDAQKAKRSVDGTFAYEISLGKVEPLKVEYGFSILSLVGDDMKNQSGAGSRMFDALGRKGINIRAIAQGSSEKNISAVVETSEIKRAIRALHGEFFGKERDRLNLFIAGKGNIGATLIRLVTERKEQILRSTGKDIAICGLADSRYHIIEKDGIASERLSDPGKLLETTGIRHNSPDSYIDSICRTGARDSIFIDCTSSKEIASAYTELFRNGISVVTCNKIAGSSHLPAYKAMKAAALENGCRFGYETTVGASLPIIATIRQLINAGDEIESFEAVLSGTMNYIFDHYDGISHFSEIVREARTSGYSEPDPRIDLSGKDVLRKSVILARECGQDTEMEDIDFTPVLAEEYFKGSCDSFFGLLEANEEYFRTIYRNAAGKGCRLRFITRYENGRTSVGLQAVGKDHPFHNLEGTNNSIIIKSRFYPDKIRIDGAGAGRIQTALGILNDIIY